MSLKMGIVGMPNVGKSSLFNAITQSSIEAENFPFCTIEPNQGIVPVPDERLDVLSELSGSQKMVPATIEFVDIAGLVKGASKGEGLGNKFLANIRECSAIVHVVRCFEDDNIVHVDGSVDPIRDMDIINTELIIADYEQCDKAVDSQHRKIKTNDKIEVQKYEVLKQARDHLAENKPLRQLGLSDDDMSLIKEYNFLTQKKVIVVCNVSESDLSNTPPLVEKVKASINSEFGIVIQLCASFEQELSVLDSNDKTELLNEYGLSVSGLEKLAKASYTLLGLETYLTTGEKETRAWTIKKGALAPEAAGVIHSDFEAGFIRANVIHYNEFIECKSMKVAKDQGVLRQEGKDYIVKDGDVIEFLFNV